MSSIPSEGVTADELAGTVREMKHIIERHQRTFVANPDEVPGITAAVDRLMAEFPNMPRPAVIANPIVKRGEAFVMCQQCIDSIKTP